MNPKLHALGLAFALLAGSGCNESGAGQAASSAPPTEGPATAASASTSSSGTGTIKLQPAAASHASIELQPAVSTRLAQRLVFQGDVGAIPERLAAIVPRLEGLVTAVHKKEGDHVKKGEPMATLESRKLAEAKLDYLEAEHGLRFANDALAREQKLVERGISSQEQYQKVVHDREAAELAHAAALQRLKLLGFSEARLHALEENPHQTMTHFTLYAPFAGEVIEKDITLGDAVSEDKPLFRLADLSALRVEVKVPLDTVPALRTGAKARVVSEGVGLEAPGEVTYIASVADTSTRTVAVRVTIANPDGAWRPGMPVRVELEGAPRDVRVAVPLGALHETDGETVVFVGAGPNTYRRVPVKLGERGADLQEVVSGLEPGVQVAVGNSLVLKSEWLAAEGE